MDLSNSILDTAGSCWQRNLCNNQHIIHLIGWHVAPRHGQTIEKVLTHLELQSANVERLANRKCSCDEYNGSHLCSDELVKVLVHAPLPAKCCFLVLIYTSKATRISKFCMGALYLLVCITFLLAVLKLSLNITHYLTLYSCLNSSNLQLQLRTVKKFNLRPIVFIDVRWVT